MSENENNKEQRKTTKKIEKKIAAQAFHDYFKKC